MKSAGPRRRTEQSSRLLGRGEVMHVLIATDGSPASIEAARRAGELLKSADQITLLSVLTEVPGDDAGGFEGSVYSPGEQEQLWKQEMAEAGEELERTAAALSSAK